MMSSSFIPQRDKVLFFCCQIAVVFPTERLSGFATTEEDRWGYGACDNQETMTMTNFPLED